MPKNENNYSKPFLDFLSDVNTEIILFACIANLYYYALTPHDQSVSYGRILFALTTIVICIMMYVQVKTTIEDNRSLKKILAYQQQLTIAKTAVPTQIFTGAKKRFEYFINPSLPTYTESYTRFSPDEMPPPPKTFQFSDPTILDAIILFNRLEKNEKNRNIFYWSKRLEEASHQQQPEKNITDFLFSTIGFIQLFKQNTDDYTADYSFGVTLYVNAEDRISSPRLSQRAIGVVEVDNYRFPVFLKPYSPQLHCNDTQPRSGTQTCKASSRLPDNQLQPGIVTAKHVTGNIIGTKIKLSCGHTGIIADIGPDGIDAAFVYCKRCRITTDTPILLAKDIAPWKDVYILRKKAAPIKTKITEVYNTKGIYDHYMLPGRIFLSAHGEEGDSGSLVVYADTYEAVGIYMAAYTSPGGQTGGIAQHAYQAAEIMQLDFYE